MKRRIVLFSILLLIVPFTALAQDFCAGDYDFDGDCDGTDAARFKQDFGRSNIKNPCPPDGPTPVPKTGQTTSYSTGDDGVLEKGVVWPNPRFTDNGNGTVTDSLTGLIWLKDANCFGRREWNYALSDCNGLNSGECGLTDGSAAGDWRLPNSNELASLVHRGYVGPAVPNTAGTGQWSAGDPFTSVQSNYYYWSSTTQAYYTNVAWYVHIADGSVYVQDKFISCYVWPVRGGH